MSKMFLLIYLATFPTEGSLIGPFNDAAFCEKLAGQIMRGKSPALAKCVLIEPSQELDK
jgi:hypothetical protein